MCTPGMSNTGACSKHMATTLCFDSHRDLLYTIKLPSHETYDLVRTVRDCPAAPPHESFDQAFNEKPDLLEYLSICVEAN